MTQNSWKNRSFLVLVLCLAGVLGALFLPSLDPSKVLFSNDGPLGKAKEGAAGLPTGFSGLWIDLNTIGNSGGSAFLSFTPILLWAGGPLPFAKFYVPLVLALL